jgi:hypothetical protein
VAERCLTGRAIGLRARLAATPQTIQPRRDNPARNLQAVP